MTYIGQECSKISKTTVKVWIGRALAEKKLIFTKIERRDQDCT